MKECAAAKKTLLILIILFVALFTAPLLPDAFGAGEGPAGDITAMLGEAKAAYDSQNYGTAETLCRDALSIKENADAYHILSSIYSKKGDLGSAVTFAEKATALDPKNVDYHLNLGRLYLSKGDVDKGTDVVKRSLEINPTNISTCDLLVEITYGFAAKNEWAKAEELVDFCRNRFRLPEYESWANYFIGEIYARQQKYDKAVEVIEALLKGPVHEKYASKGYDLLSNIYLEKKEWDKSIEAGEKALETAPDNFSAMNSIGASWIGKGKHDKAAQYLKKAFLSNPAYIPAVENIIYLEPILIEYGKFDLAEDLTLVVMNNTPDAELKRKSRFELARIYFQKKNMDKAVDCLKDLLADSKDDKEGAYIYTLLSNLYGQKRDIPNAERYAAMAGVGFYVTSRIIFGVATAVLYALIIFALFLAYRGFIFFRKKETYKERIYRFRDLSIALILPSLAFPFISILLNLVVFRSPAPPANADFTALFLYQSFMVTVFWVALINYFLFVKYALSRKEVGLSKVVTPFIMRLIIIFASYAVFNQTYEFIMVNIFHIQLPVQVIMEVLKTIKNIIPIIGMIFAGCVLIPVLEEIIFRGFFYPALKRHTSVAGGIILSSFLFAMIHLDIFPYGAVPVMALGAALAYLKEKTDSLIPPIILHGLNNAIAFVIFYLFVNK